MKFSTLFKTSDDLLIEAQQLITRLQSFAYSSQEIPAIIDKIDHIHKTMLDIDRIRLSSNLSPTADAPGTTRRTLEILNKYLNFQRLDDEDMRMLPQQADEIHSSTKLREIEAYHLTIVLRFHQEKEAYINRVRLFLTELAKSLKSREFNEVRLKWVHEDEHQPYWLEYDYVEGYTPWEMQQVQQELAETLQQSGAITDRDILQCFARVAKLFDKAIHPGPSLLRRKMLAATAEFYQQQINNINQLSFIALKPMNASVAAEYAAPPQPSAPPQALL